MASSTPRLTRRQFGGLAAGAVTIAAMGSISAAFTSAVAQETGPIKVGILHSLSGTMAISETTLKDVMLMLIEQQNAKGGVLGRKLEAVVVDPATKQIWASVDLWPNQGGPSVARAIAALGAGRRTLPRDRQEGNTGAAP